MRAKCIAVPSATPHRFRSLTMRWRPEWLLMVPFWTYKFFGGSNEERILLIALHTVSLLICLVWQSLRMAGKRYLSSSDGNFHLSVSLTIPMSPLFRVRTFATPTSRSRRSFTMAGFKTCLTIARPFFKGATHTLLLLKSMSRLLNFKISVILQHSMCVNINATCNHVGPLDKTCFSQRSQSGPAKALAFPNENWGGLLLGGLPLLLAMVDSTVRSGARGRFSA